MHGQKNIKLGVVIFLNKNQRFKCRFTTDTPWPFFYIFNAMHQTTEIKISTVYCCSLYVNFSLSVALHGDEYDYMNIRMDSPCLFGELNIPPVYFQLYILPKNLFYFSLGLS